jgi:hypothetical protein
MERLYLYGVTAAWIRGSMGGLTFIARAREGSATAHFYRNA